MGYEITYKNPVLIDGGLLPSFLREVDDLVVQDGLRVKDHSIWFDIRGGREGAWFVTFHLEDNDAHSS